MVHLWAVIGVAEVRTLTLYQHAYGLVGAHGDAGLAKLSGQARHSQYARPRPARA